jgi:hypothetical protein
MWEKINIADWKNTPFISGRVASESDVKSGNAVFYIKGTSTPAEFNLPCCAMQLMDDGTEQPVIIIQAENTEDGFLLGVRLLSGGNGICMVEEVRLIAEGFIK